METEKITLRNEFHNTEVGLLVDRDAYHQGGADLSRSQILRARRELCGVQGCQCGDELGCRGAQQVWYETGPDGLTATCWPAEVTA